MKYYLEKTTSYTFEEAVAKVTLELKDEGFGVLSDIDIHEQYCRRNSKQIKKCD